MASLRDAVCVSFDGPVVSLRSTTGYRLRSRWDQDAEDVLRSLPNQRVTDTARLARLKLAVHGLSGDIKQGKSHYEDLEDSLGRFDFVPANPPFDVSNIDKERLAVSF